MNGFALTLAAALLAQAPADDYTAETLRNSARDLEGAWASYQDVPLDVKAEFFEWTLWRYHRNPLGQVYNRAKLPATPGERPEWRPGGDTSTWNGALLAGLCCKYAVTRDGETLRRIDELCRGLHAFFEVTGQPGLPARTMTLQADQVFDGMQAGEIDGTPCWHLADPAKGTVNQIAIGYAGVLQYALPDLPADTQELVKGDIIALVLHLIDHEYHLTNFNGEPTTYGDITPVVATVGVPFNAQVAYLIVSLGWALVPEDEATRNRINHQFGRLRHKHHAYYESPLKSLVLPQAVAASPLIRSFGDRNHVINAAYAGLMLELYTAQRDRREIDREFVYQLGQTICFGLDRIGGERNALCNFMFAGLLQDAAVAEAMLTRPDAARAVAQRGLLDGVEQLRRFRLERFEGVGTWVKTDRLAWNDALGPDDFYWKADPTYIFQPSGQATDVSWCAIDYLCAYWLLRLHNLDADAGLRHRHADVLAPTPGLAISPSADEPFPPPAGPEPAAGPGDP